jgi:hypothetical protein
MARLAYLVAALVAGCGGGSSSGGPDGTGGGDGPIGGSDGGGGGDGAVTPAGARVFDPNVLHEVTIEVETVHLDQLENDQEARVPCLLTVDGETVANAGIRKKGQTSLRPLSDKPGFSIKVNEFVPGQRIDGLKKLLLDNSIQDPTFVTGHFGYELYRRAGLPAPRTSHGVVTFNGEDKGIYVLEEAVNQQFLAAHYVDGSGNLYEGPWDFPQGAGAADLKDEIIEMRSRADLEALTDVVMNSDDADLAAALEARLDVDQFLVNFAVEMGGALWDNYAYAAWNFYLYDVPADGRFVMLTHGLNWPYWHADLDPFDLYAYPWGPSTPPGYLCERIMRIPALETRYREALRAVARDAWDVAALEARVAQAEAALHSRSFSGGRSADDVDGFDAQVGDAYAFIRERKTYLSGLLGL